MNAALAAAPAHARYQWWRSVQAVKGLDTATLSRFFPSAVRTLWSSPLERGPFVIAAHQAALLATACFWTVLVAALYLGWWRNIAHDLAAMILKDPRHRPRRWLPVLVPLALLAFKPGWLGFLSVLSAPLLIQTRGRPRVLLLATCFCALALTFPAWPALKNAVPTIDPNSEVNLLHRASVMPPSADVTTALEQRLAESRDAARTNRLLVPLAIQEARRGRYTRSTELFDRVLQSDAANYPAMVGKANNTYYLGRLDDAVRLYEDARRAHPTRGEVPFNVAQVYFKKLFIPEATAALEEARALGFAPEVADKTPNKRNGYSAVAYPGLTTRQLADACRYEADGYPPLVSVSAWRRLLGAPPLPLYVLVGAPLVLGLLAVMWWSRQNDPRECDNCGTPLCGDCCHHHDSTWLCAGCGETAQRSKSDMVLATLLKNKSRSEGMAHAARVVRLGRVLPGAGHLANDRVWAAWLRLSLVAAGLFLVLGGWAFDPGAEWETPGLILASETVHPVWLPLPAALWPGWSGLPVVAGLACLVLAWLIAMLDGPGLRRLPERFSLTPHTADREPAPGHGAGNY